jgi:hypothetical protein
MPPKGRAAFLRALFYQSSQISPPDNRPVSGMVGQKTIAFLIDPWGKKIRFVRREAGPDDVGPANYDPEKPDTFTKDLKISPNSRRFEFMRPPYPVGPGDHPTVPPAFSPTHRIQERPAETPVKGFVSGDLCHPEWGPQRIALAPIRRRFPSVNFAKEKCSSQFNSKVERNLFEPSGIDQFYDLPTTVGTGRPISSIFATEIPRFMEVASSTPGPDRYQIDSHIGSGRKTSLCDLWGPVDRDPPVNTPGPGYYSPTVKQRGKSVPPRSRYIPVELREKREPPKRPVVEWPAPGQYDAMVIESRMKPRIRDKASPAVATLGETPAQIQPIPGPGYDTRPEWKGRGGVISGLGHRDPVAERLVKTSDHALAFRTLHSSLIQRSCNSKVRRSQESRPV